MPRLVVQALADALNSRRGKAMRGARILVMGVAYKKDVDDLRESPSLKLIELMEAMGAAVDFHDPHIAEIHTQREHVRLDGRRGVGFDQAVVSAYDAALIATDHTAIDYAALVAWSARWWWTRATPRAASRPARKDRARLSSAGSLRMTSRYEGAMERRCDGRGGTTAE